MKRTMLAVAASGLALSGCDLVNTTGAPSDPPQGAGEPADPRRSGSTDLAVEWRPVDFSANGAFFSSVLTIENRGPGTLGSPGRHLYFSFVRRILTDGEGDGTTVQNLAGQGVHVDHADAAAS